MNVCMSEVWMWVKVLKSNKLERVDFDGFWVYMVIMGYMVSNDLYDRVDMMK